MPRNQETQVLKEIIPTLPASQVDSAVWEKALNSKPFGPAEFARLVRGEWNVMLKLNFLPMLADTEDPHAVTDAGKLLDYWALNTLELVHLHEIADIRDLPTLKLPPAADPSHLSRTSRQMVGIQSIGIGSWREGWDRA